MAGRLPTADVPRAQLGQGLALALAGGREHERGLGPVLAGLLGDLGQVGDVKPLAVEHQIVERPPGRAGHVIGEVDLGFGRGLGLQFHHDLDERDLLGLAALLGRGQARLGGGELPLGGALAGGDLAPFRERARSGRGQVAGHARQLVVAGPAGADRPREGGGSGLRQVAEEAEPGLLGGILVDELLHRVAPALDLGPQPRGLLAQRLGADPAAHLDVEQGEVAAAGGDADAGGVDRGRKIPDDDRSRPGRQLGHAGAQYPRAVPEHGHAGDRRVHRLVSRPRPCGRRCCGGLGHDWVSPLTGRLLVITLSCQGLEPGGAKVRHLAVRPWRLPPSGRTRRSRSRPRGRCCRGRRPG